MKGLRIFITLGLVVFVSFLSGGCSFIKNAQRADMLERQNMVLRMKIKDLKGQRQELPDINQDLQKKDKRLSELEQAKADLEAKLWKEMEESKASIEMNERGLVLTFLAEVFFDSGKNILRSPAKESLLKVAEVLNSDIVESHVAVEGFTDNVPITKSGWISNWELSTARSLSVLHFLIDEAQVDPYRLSAVGYGAFRPIATNDTTSGRQKNRRVEIVILPSTITKIRE